MDKDVDLTQLWYELKMEIIESDDGITAFTPLFIYHLMNDMEARLKGGKDYE